MHRIDHRIPLIVLGILAGVVFGPVLGTDRNARTSGVAQGSDQKQAKNIHKTPGNVAYQAGGAGESIHCDHKVQHMSPVVENLANRMRGDIPVLPTIVVDYRDDEATRMREAGLLVGSLPLQSEMGGVAAGTLCLAYCTGNAVPYACCMGPGTGTCTCCSFAVDCDDSNPCTDDTCDFTPGWPAGSGACLNTPVPNGQDGSPGTNLCPGNFGLACGGCSDGLFCNGVETCQNGVCTPGTPPCAGPQVCSETITAYACDNSSSTPCVSNDDCGTGTCVATHCQGNPCGSSADCQSAGIVGAPFAAQTNKKCNGTETCISGACVAGTNPCGSNAMCGEKQCSLGLNVDMCNSDADCGGSLGTCSLTGPVCLPGRCCTNAPQPACSRRLKRGTCGGATGNAGAACASGADCTSGTCSQFAGSCDGTGGNFYGGDDGTIPPGGGLSCPILEGVPMRCPTYGSGIAPPGPYVHLLGPISHSPSSVSPFGTPLQKLGDDYQLSVSGFLALQYLRFAGGSAVEGVIALEFYDQDGNFVEDVFFAGSPAFGIHPVRFEPPVTIPARGYLVQRVAPGYSPNARHVWATTDAVDVGSNDPAKLWVNAGPVAGNFGTTGILAFELEGTAVAGPSGACCYTDPDVCNDAQLPWVCRGTGGVFLGNGSVCGTGCSAGACCNPATGACTVESQASCTAGGRDYLGNGTDCDADHGYDDGQQHCCPQPPASYSGADDCEDVTLHIITAPPYGETKVLTITGDNSGATSTLANPDSCFDPSDDPNAEPGWWEGFAFVDDCLIVYIDHCCTDPVHRPAYSVLHKSCPCGSPIPAINNPYRFGEPAQAYGAPYCADDDNAWQCFGLLGSGTYYYPIYSALAGHHGQYQLHIVAQACPRAACCVQDQCVDDVNQFQCDALGGVFLAPPHLSPAISVCTGTDGQPGSTCYDGSCCTGPLR